MLDIYVIITITLYGIAVILLQREVKKNNFKMRLFYGTHNVILYYREIKKRNESLSKRFWFYIFATSNLVLFIVIFIINVIK